jgi:hypothetical protein
MQGSGFERPKSTISGSKTLLPNMFSWNFQMGYYILRIYADWDPYGTVLITPKFITMHNFVTKA